MPGQPVLMYCTVLKFHSLLLTYSPLHTDLPTPFKEIVSSSIFIRPSEVKGMYKVLRLAINVICHNQPNKEPNCTSVQDSKNDLIVVVLRT